MRLDMLEQPPEGSQNRLRIQRDFERHYQGCALSTPNPMVRARARAYLTLLHRLAWPSKAVQDYSHVHRVRGTHCPKSSWCLPSAAVSALAARAQRPPSLESA